MKVSTKIEGGAGDWEFTIRTSGSPDFHASKLADACGYETRDDARAEMMRYMRDLRDALDAEIKRLDR